MTMRQLAVLLYFLLAACGKGPTGQATVPPITGKDSFTNPLLPSGPDPWVIQQDTMYYYMNTLGNRIAVYSTSRMSELSNARLTTIWTPPVSGAFSKEIWAPELHQFGGKWYMYFAADDGSNVNHRLYVLENDAADPLAASWVFKGKIADTANDNWAIDASAFEFNNQLYLIWSGWPGAANTEQDIYIAKMSDPLTVSGPRVMISSPVFQWEKEGAPPAVNEGPEPILNSDGQLFLTYSASGCWTDNYCLGLLTLKKGGDPLNAADWTKTPEPVFGSQPANGAYSPGHNGFFVSRDGKENWLIYHANSSAAEGCGDTRNPRMQAFSWNSDGTPEFRSPVQINVPLARPSGE
jgi:GH43 family beta-xylosidase